MKLWAAGFGFGRARVRQFGDLRGRARLHLQVKLSQRRTDWPERALVWRGLVGLHHIGLATRVRVQDLHGCVGRHDT